MMAVIAFRDCVNQTPGEEDPVVHAFMPEVMPYLVNCLREDSPDTEQLLEAFNVCLFNYPRTLGRPAGTDLPEDEGAPLLVHVLILTARSALPAVFLGSIDAILLTLWPRLCCSAPGCC